MTPPIPASFCPANVCYTPVDSVVNNTEAGGVVTAAESPSCVNELRAFDEVGSRGCVGRPEREFLTLARGAPRSLSRNPGRSRSQSASMNGSGMKINGVAHSQSPIATTDGVNFDRQPLPEEREALLAGCRRARAI